MFDNDTKKIFSKHFKFIPKLAVHICTLKNILSIFQEGNIDHDVHNKILKVQSNITLSIIRSV